MSDTTSTLDDAVITQIRALDYSHSWTTDVTHIIELYQRAKAYAGKPGLEIGSFRGHSTFAIANAGVNLAVYDIDQSYEAERKNLLSNFTVEWNMASGQDCLLDPRTFDFIFHDSDHGNHMIPELSDFFKKKLNPGGLMVIHDIDALNLESFLSAIGRPEYVITQDNKGRQLGSFFKPS